MTTRKIAISLPAELVDRTRSEVRRGRARSVSAYIAAALQEKVTLDQLHEMLTSMLAETGGPLTLAEQQAADEALGVAQTRKKRAR